MGASPQKIKLSRGVNRRRGACKGLKEARISLPGPTHFGTTKRPPDNLGARLACPCRAVGDGLQNLYRGIERRGCTLDEEAETELHVRELGITRGVAHYVTISGSMFETSISLAATAMS